MKRHFSRSSYKPPSLDSDRARAQAQSFLTGARSLNGVTAAELAHRYHLSPKVAEYMLTIALQRREARG